MLFILKKRSIGTVFVTLCKSKIHKARVTACEPDYEGSLLIDTELLKESGILPYEKILVSNASNGERFETYAIPGTAGKKQIMLNGPAAKLGKPGDHLTIMAFGIFNEKESFNFKPKIIVLNDKNEIIQKKGSLA